MTRHQTSFHRRIWLKRVAFLVGCFWLVSVFAPAKPATAHPLGNFTINRYSRIMPALSDLHLFYVLDMAEIPTFQAQADWDSNGNKVVDATELSAYKDQLTTAIAQNLSLTLNGQTIVLTPQDSRLTFPDGQGGLKTTRLEIDFFAPIAIEEAVYELHYSDGNYADRLGWREILVVANAGISLIGNHIPTTDVSHALTQYPQDLLQAPLTLTDLTFSLQPATMPAISPELAPVPELAPAPEFKFSAEQFSTEKFTQLMAETAQTPSLLFTALIVAFGLGALHSLSPGHGKTIVGAYLVGSKGNAKHAFLLGITTAITHTSDVFLLGLVVLFASRTILPEKLYPWLSLISGLMVVGIGFTLARNYWRRWRATRSSLVHAHSHHEHGHHDHDHGHHDHGHHDHDTHSHLPPETITWRNVVALGISGGLLPCPAALVVLLTAVALGQVGLGLVLIISFSLGLAAVLTGMGLLLVYAGNFFKRIPTQGGFITLAPVISAVVIITLGAGIAYRGFVATGLFG